MAVLVDRTEIIKPVQNDMAEDSEDEEPKEVLSTLVLAYDLKEKEVQKLSEEDK